MVQDFDYYIDEYMYYCRSRRLRPKTMQSYEQTLRLFERWCEEEENLVEPGQVTEQVIRRYICSLQERGKYTFYADESGTASNTAAQEPVTETDGKVTITITIPEELLNSDPTVMRTYKIVRVHEAADGSLVTDVIEGVFNPEDNSFTFQTDKFSTYALAYADSKSGSPATGDTAMVGLYVTMALLTAAAGIVVLKKKAV